MLPVSWLVIAVLSVAYWIVLFLRMRLRGRKELSRAIHRAAGGHAPGESFDVIVPLEVRPLRTAGIVLALPVLLVVIRFLLARGAR